jgi:hypothetical protein
MTNFKDFMLSEAGVMPTTPVQPNQAQQGGYVPPQWQKLQVNFAPGQRDIQVVRPTGGYFNLSLTPQQLQMLGTQLQPAKPGQPATTPQTPAAAPQTPMAR